MIRTTKNTLSFRTEPLPENKTKKEFEETSINISEPQRPPGVCVDVLSRHGLCALIISTTDTGERTLCVQISILLARFLSIRLLSLWILVEIRSNHTIRPHIIHTKGHTRVHRETSVAACDLLKLFSEEHGDFWYPVQSNLTECTQRCPNKGRQRERETE